MAISRVESDEAYNYLFNGEPRQGIVIRIAPVGQTSFVFLQNGDKIPLAEFQASATPVGDDMNIDETPHVVENPSHYAQVHDNPNVDIPGMDMVQLDENGMPILGGGNPEDLMTGNGQHVEIVDPSKVAVPMATKAEALPPNDPIRMLIEKAAKKEATIDMELLLEMPDKNLISVIQTSFGDDALEKVFTHLINNIDPEKFRKSLFDKLYEYYEVEPPGDNQE